MDIDSSKALDILARPEALHQRCRPDDPWVVEQRLHDYSEDTMHFAHVVSSARDANGETAMIVIGRYPTPQLTALLVLMRYNLPDLVRRAPAAADPK